MAVPLQLHQPSPAAEIKTARGLKPFIVSREFAALLGVSRVTFTRWRSRGLLPQPIRGTGWARWRTDEIIRWLRCGQPTKSQWDQLQQKGEHWLAGLDVEVYGRLAAVGLVAPKAATTTRLGEFIDAYIAGRPDIKPRTQWNLEICARRLVEHFGKDRLLRNIKSGDADDWCALLRAKYANATATRTIKRAKQFFAAAFRKELIARNLFADCKAGHLSNPARSHFGKPQDISLILQACPDSEWRFNSDRNGECSS